MIARLERFLFYSFILLLPTQFGKHFWPDFSKIYGIRLDYLSPTLYLTDLIIIALLLCCIKEIFTNKNYTFNIPWKLQYSTVILILLECYYLLTSTSPLSSLVGFLKLLEYIFLSVYTLNRFSAFNFKKIMYTLFLSSFVVSMITILQFIHQSSLGGIFYFLGERSIHVSTPQAATMQIFNKTFLRPYSTFSHPNSLAYYLFFCFFILLAYSTQIKGRTKVMLLALEVLISSALLLTFSRVLILIFVIGLVLYSVFLKQKRKTLVTLLFCVSIIFIGILSFSDRFSSLLIDASYRQDLNTIAFHMISTNALFGVGFHNFYYHEVFYQKNLSPIFLQPVHNIFLLCLAETGVVGLGLFLLLLKNSADRLIKLLQRKENKDYYCALFIIFASTLISGLFDHFPLTLQQSQLQFALLIGLIFAKKKV